MGTRADFYVGRGKEAEWLGSIAFDGYPKGLPSKRAGGQDLKQAATEEEFRNRVKAELEGRDDATFTVQGWPWPWEDSRTTDYSYAFDKGKVWASSFGSEWFLATDPEPDVLDDRPKTAVFPNMKHLMNVTFGKRSGLVVIEKGKVVEEP